MHIAYSAISGNQSSSPSTSDEVKRDKKLQARFKGYEAACKKYEHEIMAIQQLLPGWQPRFK
jgi:hypothetical protein